MGAFQPLRYQTARDLAQELMQAFTSGEADQVFQGLSRREAMDEAERIARDRAVESGADRATLALVDIEDLPLAYMPGGELRVRARVVGEIAA